MPGSSYQTKPNASQTPFAGPTGPNKSTAGKPYQQPAAYGPLTREQQQAQTRGSAWAPLYSGVSPNVSPLSYPDTSTQKSGVGSQVYMPLVMSGGTVSPTAAEGGSADGSGHTSVSSTVASDFPYQTGLPPVDTGTPSLSASTTIQPTLTSGVSALPVLKNQGVASAANLSFESMYPGIACSGIQNNQTDAELIAHTVSGGGQGMGYAAYGADGGYTDLGYRRFSDPMLNKVPFDKQKGGEPGMEDGKSDLAAVTQYAAAAGLAVKLERDSAGKPVSVAVDWEGLGKMNIETQANETAQKLKYENPKVVAEQGYDAVMKDLAQRGIDPKNAKDQFIALTGHSGGGQSSFYTALKLATSGYTNLSLAGLDMAMTPHQREVLEALGVKVTNFTSHQAGIFESNLIPGALNPSQPSQIGNAIGGGMGGGDGLYDMSIERKNHLPMVGPSPSDTVQNLGAHVVGTHSIVNDPNVVTSIRFAQWLDATGQHGSYSTANYQAFLSETTGKQGGTNASTVVINGQTQQADPRLGEMLEAQSAAAAQSRANLPTEKQSPNIQPNDSLAQKALKTLGGETHGETQAHQEGTQTYQTWNDRADWIGQSMSGVGEWIQQGSQIASDNLPDFGMIGTVGGGVGNAMASTGQFIDQNSALVGAAAAFPQDGITGLSVRWMQSQGIDASNVSGATGYAANNPSALRDWESQLSPDGTWQRTPVGKPK